ncbi:diguanylate cyclase [Shewanella eurypsychrophilus]|uniref:diguanylate cyclase n=1 Tax=Shewanella eurypsychrophilus TaxID=2593656 RepID=A0ABX6V6L8_9GAMM|nr:MULTISPECIES: diguanylate cyclase [Shewanella]QFU22979.1 diguanylate cyclase [Shewanella sp. YLB-09]QPG58265.1 diguanylate cyclase [Shewanella eurypsychrophilus]
MFNVQDCLSSSKQSSIDLDKWQQTVDLMSELYGSVNGSIVQFRQNEFNVVVTSSNEDNFLERDDSWPWEMKSFCRKIIETKKLLYVDNSLEDQYWQDAPPVTDGPVRSYCGLPIYWPDGSLFGTICVIDNKASQYSTTLLKMLEQFCQLITADLKMFCDYEELKSLALTDELTGLYNRRGLMILGEQRIKDAKRSKHIIGLTYLDIDNLKQMNDQFGHQLGDRCILTLAKALEVSCRDNDIKARVGGDEFIVMSVFDKDNEAPYNQVLRELSQRIIKNYQLFIKEHDPNGLTSVSYGGLIFKHHELHTLEEMIEKADQLMYQNKQSKR